MRKSTLSLYVSLSFLCGTAEAITNHYPPVAEVPFWGWSTNSDNGASSSDSNLSYGPKVTYVGQIPQDGNDSNSVQLNVFKVSLPQRVAQMRVGSDSNVAPWYTDVYVDNLPLGRLYSITGMDMTYEGLGLPMYNPMQFYFAWDGVPNSVTFVGETAPIRVIKAGSTEGILNAGQFWQGPGYTILNSNGAVSLVDALSDAQWSVPASDNPINTLTFQSDGNLCARDNSNAITWCSDTYSGGANDSGGQQGEYLVLSPLGIQIYDAAGNSLWSSGSENSPMPTGIYSVVGSEQGMEVNNVLANDAQSVVGGAFHNWPISYGWSLPIKSILQYDSKNNLQQPVCNDTIYAYEISQTTSDSSIAVLNNGVYPLPFAIQLETDGNGTVIENISQSQGCVDPILFFNGSSSTEALDANSLITNLVPFGNNSQGVNSFVLQASFANAPSGSYNNGPIYNNGNPIPSFSGKLAGYYFYMYQPSGGLDSITLFATTSGMLGANFGNQSVTVNAVSSSPMTGTDGLTYGQGKGKSIENDTTSEFTISTSNQQTITTISNPATIYRNYLIFDDGLYLYDNLSFGSCSNRSQTAPYNCTVANPYSWGYTTNDDNVDSLTDPVLTSSASTSTSFLTVDDYLDIADVSDGPTSDQGSCRHCNYSAEPNQSNDKLLFNANGEVFYMQPQSVSREGNSISQASDSDSLIYNAGSFVTYISTNTGNAGTGALGGLPEAGGILIPPGGILRGNAGCVGYNPSCIVSWVNINNVYIYFLPYLSQNLIAENSSFSGGGYGTQAVINNLPNPSVSSFLYIVNQAMEASDGYIAIVTNNSMQRDVGLPVTGAGERSVIIYPGSSQGLMTLSKVETGTEWKFTLNTHAANGAIEEYELSIDNEGCFITATNSSAEPLGCSVTQVENAYPTAWTMMVYPEPVLGSAVLPPSSDLVNCDVETMGYSDGTLTATCMGSSANISYTNTLNYSQVCAENTGVSVNDAGVTYCSQYNSTINNIPGNWNDSNSTNSCVITGYNDSSSSDAISYVCMQDGIGNQQGSIKSLCGSTSPNLNSFTSDEGVVGLECSSNNNSSLIN